MSDKTTVRPHAITCIKQSIYRLLLNYCRGDLTVSCDRDDCWNDEELFKFRKAINIVTRNDVIGASIRQPRGGKTLGGSPMTNADDECFHKAFLNVDFQVYVSDCEYDEGCNDPKSQAYNILSHITHVLTSYQSEILGRHIYYKGSEVARDSENDIDLVVVTGNFEVHYHFDQTRPWVVH